MQITLEQAEIETAIRQYIDSQVTIKQDQQVDISLAATRGASGMTATISISAKVAEPTAGRTSRKLDIEKTVRVARNQKSNPDAAEPTDPEASQAATGEAVEDQGNPGAVEPTDEAVATSEAVGDGVQEAEDANAEQEQEAEQEQTPPEAAKPTGSLFGGLNQPRNK